MLGFSKHDQPAILTGSLTKVHEDAEKHRTVDGKWKQTILLIVLIVLTWLLAMPAEFQISQGTLTITAMPGKGGIDFSLGPLGQISVATHKTPVNLRLNLQLQRNIANGQNLNDMLINGINEFESQAKHAITEFIAMKIALLILIGAVIGMMYSENSKRLLRSMIAGLLFGVASMGLVLVSFALSSWLTYDDTPDVQYSGYMADFPLPKLVQLAKQIGGDYRISNDLLRDYSRGLSVVSQQKGRSHRMASAEDSIRILQITDVQTNMRGLQIANDILNGELKPFSAVILTGDLVQLGMAAEVKLEYKDWPQRTTHQKLPVLFVGGNHEDTGSMNSFESLGYESLGREIVDIDGLAVIGADDPLAYSYEIDEPDDSLLADSSARLAEKWLATNPLPQIVAVHNLAQATDIIKMANQKQQPLTVLFGHDHETSVKTDDYVTLVGGGTSGASGFDSKARDPQTPYTYQVLEFSRGVKPILLSVTTVSYNDQDGSYSATYHPID